MRLLSLGVAALLIACSSDPEGDKDKGSAAGSSGDLGLGTGGSTGDWVGASTGPGATTGPTGPTGTSAGAGGSVAGTGGAGDGGSDTGGSGTSGVGGAGGGSPAAGACCTPSAMPGCSEAAVQDCVCDSDQYCCTIAWDDLCVDIVNSSMCGACM